MFKKYRTKLVALFIFCFIWFCGMFSYYIYVKNVILQSKWESNIETSIHTIYDRNNKIISTTSKKNLNYLELNEMPDLLIKTAILIEDRRFYQNCGIDFMGLARAAITFIPSLLNNSRPVGGSTITQQLVRQLFLHQNLSFIRKFKELFYSVVFTILYSKIKIIEIYFNHSYFGYGSYGVSTICQILFSKSLDELNCAEIALLVALLNMPATKNKVDFLNKKQKIILKAMKDENLITENEYESTKNIVFNLIEVIKNKTCITQEIRKYIIDNYGRDQYETKNYSFFTSIDKDIQKIAEEALIRYIIDFDEVTKWNGPIDKIKKTQDLYDWIEKCGEHYRPVMMINSIGAYQEYNGTTGLLTQEQIDKYQKTKANIEIGDVIILSKKNNKLVNIPTTIGHVTIIKATGEDAGDILASAGNNSNFLVHEYGLRHPGSCMKMFAFLLAMEEGIDPSISLPDVEGCVMNNRFFPKIIHHKDAWIVHNWDLKFEGPCDLNKALVYSRNMPFFDLILNHIGIKKYREYLIKWKVIAPNDQVYPATIIGNLNITPRDFAGVCISLANGGFYFKPQLIKEIKDHGLSIFKSEQQNDNNRLFKQSSWSKLLKSMQECAHTGSARILNGLGIQYIYAKTGTSGDNKDALLTTLCTSKKYGPIIIYVGLCRKQFDSLGDGVMGCHYPTYITRQIVKEIDLLDMPLENSAAT